MHVDMSANLEQGNQIAMNSLEFYANKSRYRHLEYSN